MSEIFVRKVAGTLVPADSQSEEIVAGLKRGECLRLKYSKPRNPDNHRRFFAMIQITFDIQNHFTNQEHYRKWLTMKAGAYHVIVAPNGTQIFEPDSISFSNMGEIEFQALFSNCLDTFLEAFGSKISKDELVRVVDFS